MIKAEVAFTFLFLGNFAAPLLAYFAGRIWPSSRKILHTVAALWIILSIFILDELTVTPRMFGALDVDPDTEDYEGLNPFLALVCIFVQQVLLLTAYAIGSWYSGVSKRIRTREVLDRFR